MWMTCTLLAGLALAPAQAGDLSLNNIRATYGLMGAVRPDSKLLPGDIFFVAFDIEGIIEDPTGKVQYSMAMEVTDSHNKVLFKQDPRELEAINSLGGNRLPAFAHVDVGLDQPPGTYTLKVTVTDRAGRKSQSFERPFEVVARDFGLVRLSVTGDTEMRVPIPSIGAAGQTIWVHLVAVGFQRGGDKKEPDLAFEIQALDEKGQPALPKPFPGDVKEAPKDLQGVPVDFPVNLNRPGKFTMNVKVTDRNSKKTAEINFPLAVMEPK